MATLVGMGKRVVSVLDNLSSRRSKPAVPAMRLGASASCFESGKTARIDAEQSILQRQLQNVARRAGAIVVDPFGAGCTGDICRLITETGKPISKDDGHSNPDWMIDNAGFIDVTTQLTADGSGKATRGPATSSTTGEEGASHSPSNGHFPPSGQRRCGTRIGRTSD